MADSFHAAVSTGIDGWLDDDLAFARPWGFELDELKVPAAIWQGDQDRMVPWAHGVWLAAHVGSSQPHLVMGEGHVSLGVASLDTILGDLRAMAGAPL
jgi:pimeloyl-ACP methyl ester carboxylesterase